MYLVSSPFPSFSPTQIEQMATFRFQGIAHYHQQLVQGHTSCTAAVQHYLANIEAKQHLNALVQVYADEALQQAALLDNRLAQTGHLLPLHGVVVSIKDVLCYAAHPVSAASHMLQGHKPLYTATVVQRLIDAGAIIIGSCNCDEFAMGSTNENSAYGPTLNAANTAHVPGGSSGGSAVAVQADLCMLSLGSDTGGSVRQPADFCGVVGLKPTYGSLSRYGLIAYASSFDCVGILGHSVADVAAVYDCIAGPDAQDATSLPAAQAILPALHTGKKAYRLAYLDSCYQLPGLDPEIKTAHFSFFDRLRAAGHTVEAVPFDLLDYIVPAYYVLTTAEASSNLSRYDGVRYGHRAAQAGQDLTEFYQTNRSQGFGPEVQRRIMLGSFVLSAGYFDAFFTKAQQVRQLLSQRISHIFNGFDALLMPVSPTTAMPLGQKNEDPTTVYLADIFTVLANLTGVPGMAIPGFIHSNGLPFGLQVHTNRKEELPLHQVCIYMESLLKRS